MKRSIKFKGRLRNYMYSPIVLTILLVCMNIPLYFYQIEAGLAVSAFVVIYFAAVTVNYQKNKPFFVNELINFATQYGTVQRKLLNEFDVAYALIDYNGKLLWVNEKFTELTGKDKEYHKSITSVFSHITKEILQKKFRALYEEAKVQITDQTENCADRRFYYILEQACPKRTMSVQTSVLVLMAYYFSSCDIFEEPD